MNKILFVISYLDKGGAERALSNITQNFPMDYEIDILVNSDKAVDYEYRGNIVSLGLDCPQKGLSVLFQLKVLFKRVVVLRRLKRNNNYIACISFLDSANIANILSGKKYCKTIISIRNSISQAKTLWQFKYIVNPLSRLLYNRADKVVAVSRGVAIELNKYLGVKKERIVAIENGYPVEKIRELATETLDEDMAKVFSENKVIINVGRLTHQKGGQHLIRVFSEVHKKNADTVLIFLGDGELRNHYNHLIETLGLVDSIYILGYVENPYKYVAKATVFVMTSLYEGFPNAMAEAMCLGVPCISTDFRTGARELLDPSRIVDENPIVDVVEAQYGILTPMCKGEKYLDESLTNEEMLLAQAIGKFFSKETDMEYYKNKSITRSLDLDVKYAIKQWCEIINE